MKIQTLNRFQHYCVVLQYERKLRQQQITICGVAQLMGASASVNVKEGDWLEEDAVNSLLPYYMEDMEKCMKVHNELMARVSGKMQLPNVPVGAEDKNKQFSADLVNVLNQVRMRPHCFLAHAQNHLSSFTDEFVHRDKHNRPNIAIRTKEGRTAVMECIEFLKTAEPCPPLELNALLDKCAAEHVVKVSSPTFRVNKDKTLSLGDRFANYGNWRGSIGEVVSFGDSRAIDIVLSLLIDDGALSRGNRASVFDPSYTQVGAAITSLDAEDGSSCCVIEFAASMSDWSFFQREAVVVSSNRLNISDRDAEDCGLKLNYGTIDTKLFDKVVGSIPIDDIEKEVQMMLSAVGMVCVSCDTCRQYC
jgi:hypothetical protein